MDRRRGGGIRRGQRVKKPRILIIEDEFLVALELAAVLTDAEFETLEPTSTVEAALQAINSEPIDLAILDCNLGGRNVDEIAASLAQRQIPYVFVTGYGREMLPQKFRDAPFVSKPFDEKLLVAQVKSLIRKP